jgi:hypothetical protein
MDNQKAVDFGVSSENGWYGLLSGGVFSFADLKANWDGYQFFKYLFSGENPYLKLSEEGLISISSPFDWKKHIDWQYDELKNPCVFTELNIKRISKYINEHYDRYYKTYSYLKDQDFFDYSGKRENYYLTDKIDLKNNHYFDLRSIFY